MTPPTTLPRSGLLALTLALLLLLAAPGQAFAGAQKFSFNGDVASAYWSLDDAKNTSVFLLGFDGQFHSPPGSPEKAEDVLLGVSRSFCDEDADERVFRSFFGFDEATVDVDKGQLTEASVDADLTLDGFEHRLPDCDDPKFDEGTFRDLGEHDVELAADWDGSGGLVHSNSTFHYNGEDFKFHSNSVERYRDADATATLTGLEDIGVGSDLGETNFARISSVNDSTVFIDPPDND